MNRLTPLADTALATVTRFDHPPGQGHLDPEEEQAGCASVSFVESGTFGLTVGKRRHRLDAATLFVTWPGLNFS